MEHIDRFTEYVEQNMEPEEHIHNGIYCSTLPKILKRARNDLSVEMSRYRQLTFGNVAWSTKIYFKPLTVKMIVKPVKISWQSCACWRSRFSELWLLQLQWKPSVVVVAGGTGVGITSQETVYVTMITLNEPCIMMLMHLWTYCRRVLCYIGNVHQN